MSVDDRQTMSQIPSDWMWYTAPAAELEPLVADDAVVEAEAVVELVAVAATVADVEVVLENDADEEVVVDSPLIGDWATAAA